MMASLKSKFRGAMCGSLLGDVFGSPFEGFSLMDKPTVQKYFDKCEDPNCKTTHGFYYTDDTAMMKSVAKFLIDKEDLDFKYLAQLFVTEFFADPDRKYGANVREVFKELRDTNYEDLYGPAKRQFSGSGSYGNGGAMRIAPIALFFHDKYDQMIEVARRSTGITHGNVLGLNGALLQCIAVRQSLLTNPNNKINSKVFCSQLREKIKPIEDGCKETDPEHATAYQDKLNVIEQLLKKRYSAELDAQVISLLGHGISAYESVPTAIYCFLRAQNSIPGIDTDNKARRAIQYAISLGGDTDTIGCMTGAIVGAYLGHEGFNERLLKRCEDYSQIVRMADDLFNKRENSKSDQ
ncbi:ADP-ribosylhydrolase ARH3-like [Cylas formicarius]|uniref:ADP-ribosylhydrolase ARH3-like n=1 Tax=Cylas formicarius TaxID=197179 RepID=UPI002958C8A1|nr:ADP-ribosylhydrolase ARH3-like [Cylas formicarius]